MIKKIAGVAVAVAPLASFAAVDTGVSTALADLKTDVGVVALAAFVVTLVIVGYRKFNQAAK